MTSTEQTATDGRRMESIAEATRLGWKCRPDGTWSKGTGRNFQRELTAEDAVKKSAQ